MNHWLEKCYYDDLSNEFGVTWQKCKDVYSADVRFYEFIKRPDGAFVGVWRLATSDKCKVWPVYEISGPPGCQFDCLKEYRQGNPDDSMMQTVFPPDTIIDVTGDIGCFAYELAYKWICTKFDPYKSLSLSVCLDAETGVRFDYVKSK